MIPMFSIVTVTLNCVDDAIDTAKSVLMQSFTDFEYIVKDAGSTDGTIEAMQKLGIRVIVQADSGIYDAMNQALYLCRGEYVCFLNAGDKFVDGEVLSALVTFMSSRKVLPEIIVGNAQDGRFPGRVIAYSDELSKYYLYRVSFVHQACFVRRTLYLEQGGFCLDYFLMADSHFLLKALVNAPYRYVHFPRTVVYYQFGGKSDGPEALPILQAERRAILRQFFSRVELRVYSLRFMFRLVPLKRFIVASSLGKVVLKRLFRISEDRGCWGGPR